MTTKRWYMLFLSLTILSFIEISSPMILKSFFSFPQGSGIVSITIFIPLSYLFGADKVGLIAVICHGILSLWFIWAYLAYRFHKKLEKLEP